jgi:hypothetical protein
LGRIPTTPAVLLRGLDRELTAGCVEKARYLA